MKQQLYRRLKRAGKQTAWKTNNKKPPEAYKIKSVMEKMNRKKIMLLSEKSDEVIRSK